MDRSPSKTWPLPTAGSILISRRSLGTAVLAERQVSRQGARFMAAITPIDRSELDFDNGTFDAAGFTAQTLSSWQSLAAVIDHTLLKPEATREQVENLCDETVRYHFACAMVNPIWAATAVNLLS